MGALSIAFDTTIVGALALSWVWLIIHLFFLPGEEAITRVLDWVAGKQLQVVAGVLLFAMTFTLGSAVSRMAQDFFNDDDLNVPQVLRMAMTEDRMVANVYCSMDKGDLLRAGEGNPALKVKIARFQCLRTNCCVPERNTQSASEGATVQGPSAPSAQKSDCCSGKDQNAEGGSGGAVFVSESDQAVKKTCPCEGLLSPRGRYFRKRSIERKLISAARDIFGLQENALLLKGEDSTQRLRQFHDQIMVLRGATYDGMLTFALCMFGWGVAARDEKRPKARWVLGLFPWFLLFLGVSAVYEHYVERAVEGPPYMEFSLLILGGAGVVLLWFPSLLPRSLVTYGDEKQEESTEPETEREKPRKRNGIRLPWPALCVVLAVLAIGGLLGWWATEILYVQRVLYSYDAIGALGK